MCEGKPGWRILSVQPVVKAMSLDGVSKKLMWREGSKTTLGSARLKREGVKGGHERNKGGEGVGHPVKKLQEGSKRSSDTCTYARGGFCAPKMSHLSLRRQEPAFGGGT